MWDWILVVLLLALVIRGLLRGTIAQVFALIGVFAGLWAGSWVSHWVGDHWRDAKPALAYLALRWIVAALAGIAIASLFQWWGDRLREAADDSPFGWLDRLVGGILGLALGAVFAALLSLLALQAPWLTALHTIAGASRVTPPLMHAGRALTALPEVAFPGSRWLHGRFELAERSLARSRTTPHAS